MDFTTKPPTLVLFDEEKVLVLVYNRFGKKEELCMECGTYRAGKMREQRCVAASGRGTGLHKIMDQSERCCAWLRETDSADQGERSYDRAT
jgi:hypothetical protein